MKLTCASRLLKHSTLTLALNGIRNSVHKWLKTSFTVLPACQQIQMWYDESINISDDTRWSNIEWSIGAFCTTSQWSILFRLRIRQVSILLIFTFDGLLQRQKTQLLHQCEKPQSSKLFRTSILRTLYYAIKWLGSIMNTCVTDGRIITIQF